MWNCDYTGFLWRHTVEVSFPSDFQSHQCIPFAPASSQLFKKILIKLSKKTIVLENYITQFLVLGHFPTNFLCQYNKKYYKMQWKDDFLNVFSSISFQEDFTRLLSSCGSTSIIPSHDKYTSTNTFFFFPLGLACIFRGFSHQ